MKKSVKMCTRHSHAYHNTVIVRDCTVYDSGRRVSVVRPSSPELVFGQAARPTEVALEHSVIAHPPPQNWCLVRLQDQQRAGIGQAARPTEVALEHSVIAHPPPQSWYWSGCKTNRGGTRTFRYSTLSSPELVFGQVARPTELVFGQAARPTEVALEHSVIAHPPPQSCCLVRLQDQQRAGVWSGCKTNRGGTRTFHYSTLSSPELVFGQAARPTEVALEHSVIAHSPPQNWCLVRLQDQQRAGVWSSCKTNRGGTRTFRYSTPSSPELVLGQAARPTEVALEHSVMGHPPPQSWCLVRLQDQHSATRTFRYSTPSSPELVFGQAARPTEVALDHSVIAHPPPQSWCLVWLQD
ncbi:hypothetical protein J6590_078808 [Homalodisca vitripennis]|nr:hypothetical protein J6590_078808 [Homalodisca vitripennis]